MVLVSTRGLEEMERPITEEEELGEERNVAKPSFNITR